MSCRCMPVGPEITQENKIEWGKFKSVLEMEVKFK